MVEDQSESGAESQQRLDALASQVAANRVDIDALQARADAANHRAAAAEDAVDVERHRIDDLEARSEIDRHLIAELQADGILQQEHTENLEEALRTSRKIGAAMGIVMATWKVSEETAFQIMKTASQRSNRKVRTLAEEIVITGDLAGLPRI